MIRSILFLLFSVVFAYAQKMPLVFHHLSVMDGLSENTVRSTIEDKNGYMWFGCEDGLNKFDGYEFTVYRNDNADIYTISSRNIKFLYVDKKGNLWVVTSNGLNLYDPVLEIFYSFRNDKYPALKRLSGDIAGIEEDNRGNLWVTTTDDGLFKIESLDKEPKQYNYPFNDLSRHLYFVKTDTDSTLWIGTRDGLLRFNTRTGKFTDLRPQYGRGYEIRVIYRDQAGLFLCTSSGLKLITPKGELKEYVFDPYNADGISGNNVVGMIPYKNGTYLIGVDGGGVDCFDPVNRNFLHYTDELSSTNINCIYKDSKDDIWVGTYLNGINYSNTTTNLFLLKKNHLYAENSIKKGIVTNFLKDSKGNLWVATDGGGIYRRNKGERNYIHYEFGKKGLSSNVIIDVIEDEEGLLWFTTYGGGLCQYDPAKDLFKVYLNDPANKNSLMNNHTKALCSYAGKIWISGFGAGYSVFDKKTGSFANYTHDKSNPYSIPSDWIQSFFVDRDNVLWFATFRGLSRYVPSINGFKTYVFQNKKTKHHVDINTLIDIVEDENGNLWFGTMGNGLVCFNKKSGTYQTYTMEDGLSNNCVKSLIRDDQSNIWLSTNNGITRFNLETKKAKAYRISDGVPPCSFYFNSKYKDEDGRVYFGSNNGYLMIDPAMTGENKRVPPIVITKFKIFNELVSPRDKNTPLRAHISETDLVELPYHQNSITFEFAALNFNSSQNNKYAYWLEGFDEKMFMAGNQRFATYTNLNPGTYIFRVKGSNNDNVWNEEGAMVKIIIKPPFWKTWWFTTLVILSVILMLYLIYTWRTSLIRNKNMVLEETVKQRTSELEEANERLETFVYKASHDIKGPLKSIIGLTVVGQKDVKDEVALNYFTHILKSTQKLDKLLFDLLQVTKVRQTSLQLEKINFNEMVSEVLSSFENFPGYEKMKITVDIKDNGEFYSDKKLVHSIVQNLIENPIKYADPEKSEQLLNINVTASKKGAELTFKDNGIGIPKEIEKNIFEMFFKANENANGTGLGLYIVKTTVEKLKGTINLESEKGKGSTFTVRL